MGNSCSRHCFSGECSGYVSELGSRWGFPWFCDLWPSIRTWAWELKLCRPRGWKIERAMQWVVVPEWFEETTVCLFLLAVEIVVWTVKCHEHNAEKRVLSVLQPKARHLEKWITMEEALCLLRIEWTEKQTISPSINGRGKIQIRSGETQSQAIDWFESPKTILQTDDNAVLSAGFLMGWWTRVGWL